MDYSRHPAEPFKIKSIEPINLLNRSEREKRLKEARYNLFKIDAEDIYIDLLTDSGTTALSNKQWAALMLGDESYAGARSFRRFEKAVQDIFQKKYVIPTHQGRSAENMLFSITVNKGQYVINNTHFDTTRGNTLHKEGIPIDLPVGNSGDDAESFFKGNMDTEALEKFITEHGTEKIAMIIMTVTNNSIGGLPVSMSNISEVSSICKKYKLLFYFDCARFAENCYFIKQHEPGYENKSIKEIAAEMLSYADGAMMSAKKDGMSNIGGFIATDDRLIYDKITELMVVIEGFPTYGGLTGRDMDVLAVGFYEAMDEEYLKYRIGQVRYLGEELKKAGMPIVEPTGGHAVFIDAGEFLPHIKPEQFPGHSLAVAFYLEGGIRTVEIGSIMFGEIDPITNKPLAAPKELVRLAIPRRVYTASHIDYMADIADKITSDKNKLPGYIITRQPKYLRHFTCDLEPIRS